MPKNSSSQGVAVVEALKTFLSVCDERYDAGWIDDLFFDPDERDGGAVYAAFVTLNELVELDDRDTILHAQEACKEMERLRRWVNDLQAGCYINCVYCGHRYGPDSEVPASMADVLKAHIEVCPAHPLSAATKTIARLRAERDGLRDGLQKAVGLLEKGRDYATLTYQDLRELVKAAEERRGRVT